MSPINQLIVLLVAVATVGLVVIRLWRKFRPGLRLGKTVRRRRPQPQPVVAKPQATMVAAVPTVSSVAPSTLNAQRSTPVDQPSTINHQPVLPTLEAEDTPLVDNSDLAFGPLTKL